MHSVFYSIFHVLFDFSAVFLRLSGSNYLHFHFRLSLLIDLYFFSEWTLTTSPSFYSRMSSKMAFSAVLCSLGVITVQSEVGNSTTWDKPKRTYQYWCTQTPSGVKTMKIVSLSLFVYVFSNLDATTSRSFTACRSATFLFLQIKRPTMLNQ